MPPQNPDDDPATDAEGTGDDTEETLHWDALGEQSTREITPPSEATRASAEGKTQEDLDMETAGPDAFATAPIPSMPFGIGEEREIGDQTVENVDATIDMSTVQLRPKAHQTLSDLQKRKRPSVMQSADLSQTINPRELSKEDAAFWGSAAIGASNENEAEKSKLRPAIERSITESKLQIRKRDLAIPTRDPSSPSDYRLVKLLGRGGMGNVYVARQASLDRMIAVKVIKPLSKSKRKTLRECGRLDEVEHDRRQQFLSEAVVTGDLDHPNIVPIHDIAVAADNTLFYAMKRVVGQPWLKTINELSRDENVEILLKVCDAIAFAHTRGVIHRDIKPENIMLGDFGEVLVMDWGLALAKPEFEKSDSILFVAGLGGTPAFMAPEMAVGPVESIGAHSDIYLLGATLFYIVTGQAPHKADNVSQCIRAVVSNTIQIPSSEFHGELLDIALRAMATDPKDRFESVKTFQEAVRAYRSHSESVALSTVAEGYYHDAIEKSRYESYSKASHGFEQAVALWSGNHKAIEGLTQCKVDHAKAACANGDYDLGLSLLDGSDSRHLPIIEQLKAGLEVREQRASRLKLFRSLVAASLFIILVGGSVALYVINQKREEANKQRGIAVKQTDNARKQKGIADDEAAKAKASEEIAESRRIDAVKQTAEAKRQEGLAIKSAEEAEIQRTKARASEKEARESLQLAKYESYLSQIGLAKARIDGNEFDDARIILSKIRQSNLNRPPAWEWRYLWEQANQSRSFVKFDSGVIDIAADQSGVFTIVVCSDGSVHRSRLRGGELVDDVPAWSRRDDAATCVALRDDGRQLAIGTRAGGVVIVDPETGQTVRELAGHESTVTDAEFLGDDRLLTGSIDRTVALWDSTKAVRIAQCWHIAPVVGLAARQLDSGRSAVVIAAVSDAKTGRVVGWRLENEEFVRSGEFLDHDFPVASVALSEDGGLAASGDSRGNVFLWDPADLQNTDFEDAIKNAITKSGGDDSGDDSGEKRLVSSPMRQTSARARWQAHPDAVSVLQFDDSGETLLSGADDYTIRSWKIADQSLQYSLRGHGGWVRALQLVPMGPESAHPLILSGSVDGSLRTWNRSTTPTVLDQGPRRDSQLHGDQILAARLDRSGTRIISASRDRTAKVLRIDRQTMSFEEIARIETDERASDELSEGTEFLAMSTQIDTDGRRLFIGSADSTIRIWDVDSGTQLGSLPGTGLNNAFALSQDGSRLISGSSRPDAKAMLWNVERGLDQPQVLHRFKGHDQAVTAFAASTDGRVLVTGDRGGRCLVWDGVTGKQTGRPIDLMQGFRINELVISPDDRSVWVASDSGQLTEVNFQSRELERQLDTGGYVTAVSLSPGGDQAVTISAKTLRNSFVTTATLWDLSTLQSRSLDKVEAELDDAGQSTGSSARINSARFGNLGSHVVICRQGKNGRRGRVSIIDLADSASKSFNLPSQIGAPESGFLWGEEQLITLNGEAGFRWSVDAMVHEKSYRPHAAVTNACFSPDGEIAATASRSVRLWNTETGEAIDKLENPHPGAIASLDFARLGDTQGYALATSGDDGSARLWNWKDRETGFLLQRELAIDGTAIKVVRFTPDGNHVMLAAADGAIQVRSLVDRSTIFAESLPAGLSATCAAFSSDGSYLAVGATDKSAWLFQLDAGAEAKQRVMRGHADRIESIAVVQDLSDSIRVLTASRDKSARVWDPRLDVQGKDSIDSEEPIAGREVLSLRRHTQGVTAIDCTGDGDLVMTAARDGRVLLWPAKFP